MVLFLTTLLDKNLIKPSYQFKLSGRELHLLCHFIVCLSRDPTHVPCTAGGGMQRLVTMIRAQHQAWSERLAARASLLQSTLVCEQDSAPPPPGEALSASNQNPRSSSHDQDVGEAMHHQPTSSHGRVEGVATHPYHYPCPSSHDHKVGGANTSGPPTATPTVSQHDSLSIFTLSTRYRVEDMAN